MFIGTLTGIFRFSELPEEYGPYVQFKAAIDKRETINDGDEVAIINIQGTESNHVLFLDSYNTAEEIKAELKDADAKINHTSLKILENHLNK